MAVFAHVGAVLIAVTLPFTGFAGIFLPKDPPINVKNVLATQVAALYTEPNCQGNYTEFESSGNEFLKEFEPYYRNLVSVKLCGKGTFFYFNSPDMQMLSTLGHISRCGENVTKATLGNSSCECNTLPEETHKLVESFSIQYC
mmetsp:Transcript_37550/g.59422  ORF Transcript_37550/g.59422 Transcript_37550/m.59422 type:complete len:143 (-) Transcript_37550:49-477(-)|eukprot:CAMPEP_0169129232 /NCGR_PEP_ID=MMETSP1015-20121227/37013_1 /TAXON_ID=342587 /ORGANISM="Karlodinium micrum, Strain CCMP2283" /LENGTH=142 /DNA_ID=CAMNT_0009193231 /DNA_START=53 /DNA_END=481 /DNA_ORIENTATION=+